MRTDILKAKYTQVRPLCVCTTLPQRPAPTCVRVRSRSRVRAALAAMRLEDIATDFQKTVLEIRGFAKSCSDRRIHTGTMRLGFQL